MQIRFLTSVAGARFAYRQKQVVDLPEHFAGGFIRDGVAEVMPQDPVRAVKRGTKTAETTSRRGARETR